MRKTELAGEKKRHDDTIKKLRGDQTRRENPPSSGWHTFQKRLLSILWQCWVSACCVCAVQEGLLLGESVGEEKSKITDSQTDHIQFVHTISKLFYHAPAWVFGCSTKSCNGNFLLMDDVDTEYKWIKVSNYIYTDFFSFSDIQKHITCRRTHRYVQPFQYCSALKRSCGCLHNNSCSFSM